MSARISIALAQINPLVGDIDGNVRLILDCRAQAAALGADLVIFSEMVISGYPLEDLVIKPAFETHAMRGIKALAKATEDGGPAMIVGGPWRDPQHHALYNEAFLLQDGEIKAQRSKHELPNHGVFDEKRVFQTGPVPGPMPLRTQDGGSFRLGVMICEDMWKEDVAEGLQESGAEILIVINGSPFEIGKQDIRIQHAVSRITETELPLIYVNQIGGQDELVFDGNSFAMSAECKLVAQAKCFEPALMLTEWQQAAHGRSLEPVGQSEIAKPLPLLHEIYLAMVTGLRDYVNKNNFPGVVLGLSGGIDSALSIAVAVDALGAEKVHSLMMPSRYTGEESLEDAAACAQMLHVRLDRVDIEPAVGAFGSMLEPLFIGRQPDTTEENIQSRIRGVLLMAISNKLGHMVLTTGNKSEMSVGYATLYGDMCGGYSVLKDIYKTQVFELCHFRNQVRPAGCLGPEGRVIPERIITKPPSAELREDQKDEDSLPPYDMLDAILHGLIEEDLSPAQLVGKGFDAGRVRQVSNLLDLAEYKRRQAPPGVKVTGRSFGRDRRYPITNAFRRIGIKELDEPPAK